VNAVDLEIDDAYVIDRVVTGSRRQRRSTPRPSGSCSRSSGTSAPDGRPVHLTFRGTINDKLKGFYRSVFTDDSGAERVIATTQMEPTDARLAFPCWDEPDLKAVFAITLVVADGLLAVSNAAEVDRTPVDGGRVACASPTPSR
jgi:puromycin-sensitive aminopeptidase